MEEPKLYTCFEATNDLEEHVYVIYSAKLSDLHNKKLGSKPMFEFETAIKGLKSMGCGVFDSKIVLAGGLVTRDEEKEYHNGLITFDVQERSVSQECFPPMLGEKIRPVVFELYGRLYVLSTSTYVYRRSFEIYYPTLRYWDKLEDPYLIQFSEVLGNEQISGRTPYSWFVFGNCLCMSTPSDKLTYRHNARQMAKCFMFDYDEVIPFRGMATTYWKPGFSDVVVIYLSQEGVVEGRRLNYRPSYFGEPEKIFDTAAYKPDGELSSYFADFGEGNFCFTVYDNVSIHVYMFTIDRLPNKENGALNIQLKHLVDHTYSYKELSFGGNKCVSLLGCFALPSDDRKKRVEESDLYRCHFPYAESGEEDGDLDLVLEEIKMFRLDVNCDIRNFEIPTEEWRKCFEEEGLHRRHFLYGESVEKDDDISPRNKMFRLDDNCDIRNFEIPPEEWRKCFEDEGLNRRHFLYGESVENDDDISPRNKMFRLDDNCDIRNFEILTDERRKCVEEEGLYRRHFLYGESVEKDDDISPWYVSGCTRIFKTDQSDPNRPFFARSKSKLDSNIDLRDGFKFVEEDKPCYQKREKRRSKTRVLVENLHPAYCVRRFRSD